ncbi:MAG: class I SAM-dependent methyltransferase, partial [Bacteroidota bacterium]|nr:class I SAM-dependent methyltransferase [Bacteroidota bacterium]
MKKENNPDNSIDRFSNRVENYVKYRPHYPKEIISFLNNEIGLNPSSLVADIGSGPGISAENFIENGNTVFAIEPNDNMRNAAERIFGKSKNFISVYGTAESTTLQGNSLDLIISGQAFHWFDKEKCKTEFKRILKPEGYVVLMWNLRVPVGAFMNEYEKFLIRYGKYYEKLYKDDVDA